MAFGVAGDILWLLSWIMLQLRLGAPAAADLLLEPSRQNVVQPVMAALLLLHCGCVALLAMLHSWLHALLAVSGMAALGWAYSSQGGIKRSTGPLMGSALSLVRLANCVLSWAVLHRCMQISPALGGLQAMLAVVAMLQFLGAASHMGALLLGYAQGLRWNRKEVVLA
jgi:hypothetical protein